MAVAVPGDERLGQGCNVADGEVQALRSGRRHDVGGVTREVEPPPLHRLGDEAPHRRDALLEDRPLVERPAVHAEPGLELLPDPLVWPEVEILVGRALQVEA